MIRALERLGWKADRVGRHQVLVKPGCSPVTVPIHKGRDLKPNTARAILKQCGVTEEEFLQAY